jgi:hypothetical protein
MILTSDKGTFKGADHTVLNDRMTSEYELEKIWKFYYISISWKD